jgi:hypothetical protein
VKFREEDLLELFAGSSRVISVRRGVPTHYPFPVELEPLAWDVLGRTGNLRAPTARVGDTFLVGFHEEVWSDVLRG